MDGVKPWHVNVCTRSPIDTEDDDVAPVLVVCLLRADCVLAACWMRPRLRVSRCWLHGAFRSARVWSATFPLTAATEADNSPQIVLGVIYRRAADKLFLHGARDAAAQLDGALEAGWRG